MDRWRGRWLGVAGCVDEWTVTKSVNHVWSQFPKTSLSIYTMPVRIKWNDVKIFFELFTVLCVCQFYFMFLVYLLGSLGDETEGRKA